MNFFLFGLMLLTSISSFANECSVGSMERILVHVYNANTDRTNQIELGDIISNFEHVAPNFLPSLEWHLANNKCTQFSGHNRRNMLKQLFRREIKVNAIDERGVQFDTKRKLTTTEIIETILDQ